MDRRVISLCLSLSLVLLFAGCASKKVASSSGDQSGQAKTEAIQPDAIKPVPPERSFDRPSGSLPSNNSPSPRCWIPIPDGFALTEARLC